MKITITGNLGSGKSTISKMLSKELNLKRLGIGDFMGEIALERGLSLMELSKVAEKDPEIDTILDDKQISFGKNNDNFIFDSRLGWHFIPDSFKIFLKCDLDIAAVRIFNDKRDDEKENTTLDNTKRQMILRVESERKRYKEYYGVNPFIDSNYDFIVDTSNISPQKVLEIILHELKKHF